MNQLFATWPETHKHDEWNLLWHKQDILLGQNLQWNSRYINQGCKFYWSEIPNIELFLNFDEIQLQFYWNFINHFAQQIIVWRFEEFENVKKLHFIDAFYYKFWPNRTIVVWHSRFFMAFYGSQRDALQLVLEKSQSASAPCF